jgi:hypothetical protein
MKAHEGKVAISFIVYCKLAQEALFAAEIRSHFSVFVHVFMILCWNLFSRSISVCDLRTHHFKWANDMLVIDLSKVRYIHLFIDVLASTYSVVAVSLTVNVVYYTVCSRCL